MKAVQEGENWGNVVIPKSKNEIIEGVFMGEGRPIGNDKTPTICLVDPEQSSANLLLESTVIKSQLDRLVKTLDKKKREELEGSVFIRFTYKGKRESASGKSYHDFNISYDEATKEEIEAAKEILETLKGE